MTEISLTSAHWDSLSTRAVLSGWVKARELGLTVEQCDLIVNEAVSGMREMIETWAEQQAEVRS